MDGHLPPSLGPSSSGTSSTGLSGGFGFSSSAATPTAKSMPKSSTSTTRPCPTSQQGGQANKIRKIQDVMKNVLPMTPTPSNNKYRLLPPISQQACKAILCRTGTCGTCLRSSRMKSWINLNLAWFPDSDVIRLVPELTDFPYGPENMIVKAATPDMVLNPLYDPKTAPTVPPSGPPSDQSDPWLVPKSTNFPKNIAVQKGVVFGFHTMTPNEVWNFMANGLTRLEPVHNNYFGNHIPMMRMPAF